MFSVGGEELLSGLGVCVCNVTVAGALRVSLGSVVAREVFNCVSGTV